MTIELCMYHDCNCEGEDMKLSLCCKDCPNKDGCPDRCEVEDCTSCYWMTRKEVKSNDG